MNYQKQTWNHSQNDSKNIEIDLDATRRSLLIAGFSNLKSQRAGDGAWKISGPNLLTGFEPQDLVVLSGMRAVPESSRSRCCPSRDASEGTGYFQRESGVDILNGPKSDSSDSERVNNQKLTVFDVSAWDYVAEPNKPKGKPNPEQSLVCIAQAKQDRLASCQCCQQQRSHRYEVARSRTLTHSQFDSSKGPKR